MRRCRLRKHEHIYIWVLIETRLFYRNHTTLCAHGRSPPAYLSPSFETCRGSPAVRSSGHMCAMVQLGLYQSLVSLTPDIFHNTFLPFFRHTHPLAATKTIWPTFPSQWSRRRRRRNGYALQSHLLPPIFEFRLQIR
jgi:hypothetical protein